MMRWVLLSGLALTGCTTASTRFVDADTAVIAADDLSSGSPTAVRQRLLVTAARAARARGYPYFVVLAAQDTSRTGEKYFSPWLSQAHSGGGGLEYYPDRAIGLTATVRFLRASERPASGDGVYAADAVLKGRAA